MAFGALSVPNYRLYVAGHSISVTGTWVQKTAQAWLILELTDSATWLGVTAAVQHLPTLLVGPWGGLLADRLPKRRLLLVTQSLAVVPGVLLGLAVLSGGATVGVTILLAFTLGVVDALDKPTRHSFVMELVGPRHLTDAVTLNAVVASAGKITGPAVAGVLIASAGLAPAFLLNGVSYVAVVACLLAMHTDALLPASPTPRGRGQLRAGWRYVGRTPGLLGPLALLGVTGMLVNEWSVTLPVMAREAFGGDAQVFGLMYSAMGVGAVLGGIALVPVLSATTWCLVLTAWAFGLLVLVAAFAPTAGVFAVLLFFVGAASIAFRAVATALLQVRAAPDMVGRVSALLVIAISGTAPVGAPLIGWIGDTVGPRFAFGLGGVTTVVGAAVVLVYLRRHERSP